MELFSPDPHQNLLPYDGEVNYFGPIMAESEARGYFDNLRGNVPWKNDESVLFGKHIITARQVAWFGDGAYVYKYSGSTKQASPWTPELEMIRALVEKKAQTRFNSCLLNLYHHGNEGMGWHRDNEDSLIKQGTIASLSLGAERSFNFKHVTRKETVSLLLENGSLLLMKGATQSHWLHCLPKTKKVSTPRINLTFRCFKAK